MPSSCAGGTGSFRPKGFEQNGGVNGQDRYPLLLDRQYLCANHAPGNLPDRPVSFCPLRVGIFSRLDSEIRFVYCLNPAIKPGAKAGQYLGHILYQVIPNRGGVNYQQSEALRFEHTVHHSESGAGHYSLVFKQYSIV